MSGDHSTAPGALTPAQARTLYWLRAGFRMGVWHDGDDYGPEGPRFHAAWDPGYCPVCGTGHKPIPEDWRLQARLEEAGMLVRATLGTVTGDHITQDGARALDQFLASERGRRMVRNWGEGPKPRR